MSKLRHIMLAVAMFLVTASMCSAQMKLGLRFEHESYLQFEPVKIFIAIQNDAGVPMVIGSKDDGGNASIDFVVKKNENDFSKRLNKTRMVGRLTIQPGQKRTIALQLSKWYDVSKMGRYLVSLAVEFNDKKYESEAAILEVVHGIEIASEEKALSGYDNVKRLYSLRYWARDKGEDLFLVVTDPDTKTNWGLFALGPVTRVTPPTLEVTERGIVRVVHQVNKDMFIRTEFESSMEGMFFIYRTRLDADGNPVKKPGADNEGDDADKDAKSAPGKDHKKAEKSREKQEVSDR